MPRPPPRGTGSSATPPGRALGHRSGGTANFLWAAERVFPTKQRDKLVDELVQTTEYVDPETGKPYRPDEPPKVDDPDGDADSH